MFTDFAHVWTIVGAARDLRREVPLPLRVAGERVVVFRDEAGRPRALVDRCPHRGVALSLGKVRDGCLECPFHGWRFAGDGTNVHVPWNPDAKRERLGATPLPVRECGGLLWLYTAPGPAESGEPQPPDVLLRPGLSVSAFSATWNVHWTRAMENMLDWPHLPFVHRSTIGHDLPLRPDSRMDITWEERAWGAHTTIAIEGHPWPGALDYRFPNAMHLHIPIRRGTFELLSVSIPVDEGATRMLFVTVRSFLRARVFDRLFHFGNHRIAREDRAIVESSLPREVPHPGDERSVRTDGPTLRFRKLYQERLSGSSAAPPGATASPSP